MADRQRNAAGVPGYRLYDMHCHLDRMAKAAQVAGEGAAAGIATFCCTVMPEEYVRASSELQACDNVRMGVGLHPWWVDNGSCGRAEAVQAATLAAQSCFVGEIGLDFGRAHESTKDEQLRAFEAIVRACADHPLPNATGRRVLSIHAVHAAGSVLDVLERFSMTETAACIFHWFSGTGDELARARQRGCYFSVNEMMLATRRGREYARQIPEDRLLLETDAPPVLDGPYTAADQRTSLEKSLDKLAEIRHCDRDALAQRIAQTSTGLLEI